jgi:pyruvate dehydrogenase E2 component (dihydrolipoamide acetyltransferase)
MIMDEGFAVVPLTPIRKMIAARMTEATQTIPHFRLSADIEVDALFELRQQLRERTAEVNLSLNDLLIKACATALMDTPDVNVQWAGKEIHRYYAADISIVTAIEGGLSTPIVRSANTKSVWEISREVRDLTSRAAINALKVTDIIGG